MKIKALEQLASDMVGDGKKQNVFFVSQAGHGVILISRNFKVAYHFWKSLSHTTEDMLEDRQHGTICDTSPINETGKDLRTWDNSEDFLKYHPSHKF